jgi:hypothetical protein
MSEEAAMGGWQWMAVDDPCYISNLNITAQYVLALVWGITHKL